MTLVKRSNRLFPSVPSFFDDFIVKDVFDWSKANAANGASTPSVNVKEDKDKFELEVAAPGLDKKDFKVELDKDVLTISAEVETKSEETENNYTRREFGRYSFKRSFTLPERKVNGDEINASYTDGILHITLPKNEEAKPKPAKLIEIA